MWELDYKETWVPKNRCFWAKVLEKTLEGPLDSKEIQSVHPKGNQSALNIHWKDWCLSWNSNTLATWCEELTHLKRPWFWKVGGEGDDRGWDGWMASPTRWTWVWASSRSWLWTGMSGVLQFMYDFIYVWNVKNKTSGQKQQNKNNLKDTERKLVVYQRSEGCGNGQDDRWW